MKRSIIITVVAAIAFAGCGANIPRPIQMRCSMAKDRLVQQMSGYLVSKGYTINFNSAETGVLQAEYSEGGGFFTQDGKRQVSISFARDTVTLNIKTLATMSGGSVVAQTWNTENARGSTLEWVQEIVDGVTQLCESTPIKSGN